MSDNIWVSYRHPDGRTFTIGGASAGEFEANALNMGLDANRIIEDFQVLADPVVAVAVASAAAIRGPSSTSTPAETVSAAPSAPGAPSCEHGARTFRSGQGKKGPWTAWFCPQPKGAVQCEAIWG